MKYFEPFIRGLALVLAALSALAFLKGYEVAYDLAITHDPSEFQGGRGFALNAPVMLYGVLGLIAGFGAFCGGLIAVCTAQTSAVRSPAIIASLLLLIPFVRACWILLRMVIQT